VNTIILSVGVIILGLIASKYLVTPLLFYILESSVYVFVKIVSRLFPCNAKFLESPKQCAIEGIYRVYSPNPINYLLNRVPITPKEMAGYFNKSSNQPYLNYTLDMSLCPIVKNSYRRLLSLLHPKRIVGIKTTKYK